MSCEDSAFVSVGVGSSALSASLPRGHRNSAASEEEFSETYIWRQGRKQLQWIPMETIVVEEGDDKMDWRQEWSFYAGRFFVHTLVHTSECFEVLSMRGVSWHTHPLLKLVLWVKATISGYEKHSLYCEVHWRMWKSNKLYDPPGERRAMSLEVFDWHDASWFVLGFKHAVLRSGEKV